VLGFSLALKGGDASSVDSLVDIMIDIIDILNRQQVFFIEVSQNITLVVRRHYYFDRATAIEKGDIKKSLCLKTLAKRLRKILFVVFITIKVLNTNVKRTNKNNK
jgi:hypothetical protein